MGNLLKINNSLVRVKVASSLILPNKGDIIKMNLDGTSRQYRVLNVNGNVCKVMGMFDDLTSAYNSTSTTTTMGMLKVQKYEGSTLDTYLNTTWYNTLSETAKTAIVPESITCDAWYNDNTGDPDYTGTHGTSAPGVSSYTISKYTGGVLNIGIRNIFILGIQDVIDYLSDESMRVNTSAILRNVNIWKMFWNDEVKHSKYYPWLRSSSANNSGLVWTVNGNSGRLYDIDFDISYIVRPAFNINLSKIEWSTAT